MAVLDPVSASPSVQLTASQEVQVDLVSPSLCDGDGLGLFLACCMDSCNVLVIQFLDLTREERLCGPLSFPFLISVLQSGRRNTNAFGESF